MLVSILGYCAAALSTLSFAPQAWKIIQTRQTKAISLKMYVLTVAGFATWLAYGVARREWQIVISNSICLLLASFILVMKLLPPAQKKKVADALDV